MLLVCSYLYFVSAYDLNHSYVQVVSHNTSPEWKEGFTWAFDVPPKGQKLHIVCRSKSTFGKVTGFRSININNILP